MSTLKIALILISIYLRITQGRVMKNKLQVSTGCADMTEKQIKVMETPKRDTKNRKKKTLQGYLM